MDQDRIHYLDWLKVLIVYGILLFHVSLVFSAVPWLVSNHDRSIVLSAFAAFCFPWGIPAMFLISGADAWFGLRSRSPREYVMSRVRRLLLPMVAGLVVISPFQRFVVSHNPPPPWSELPAYYVSFLSRFHFEADMNWIATYWLHLWFLGYLFGISLACLPLLLWMRRDHGRRMSGVLVAVSSRRGGIFLLALPLFVSQLVLRPFFADYQEWADVATYTFVFLAGAVLFSDRRFEAAIRRDIAWIVAGGVVSLAVVGAVFLQAHSQVYQVSLLPAPAQAAFALAWSYDVWCWLLAVTYLGIRWLDFPNRVMSYLQRSILPFYVLHHPIVLTLASFVVTWNLGLWPKFGVLLVASYALTIGLYEFGVRRWAPTRALFGLKEAARKGASGPVVRRRVPSS